MEPSSAVIVAQNDVQTQSCKTKILDGRAGYEATTAWSPCTWFYSQPRPQSNWHGNEVRSQRGIAPRLTLASLLTKRYDTGTLMS